MTLIFVVVLDFRKPKLIGKSDPQSCLIGNKISYKSFIMRRADKKLNEEMNEKIISNDFFFGLLDHVVVCNKKKHAFMETQTSKTTGIMKSSLLNILLVRLSSAILLVPPAKSRKQDIKLWSGDAFGFATPSINCRYHRTLQ